MNPWIQAVIVAAVTAIGLGLGRFYFARSYRRAVWGGLAAAGWIGFVLTAHLIHILSTYSGMDWVSASRSKFLLIGFAVCFGMLGPLHYLNRPWKKNLTFSVLMGFLVLFIGIPFLGPALLNHRIRTLDTFIDSDGICRQSTSFTCGPAAAVTALKQIGLDASEAQIARVSGTIPAIGTGMWDLYQGLRKLYPPDELQCRYFRSESLEGLPSGQPVLVVMQETFWMDHCVVVLRFTDTSVTIADPTNGLRILPRRLFETFWRKTAIILRRPDFQSAGL